MVFIKKKKMLPKNEFYRILDEVVPGGTRKKVQEAVPARKIFLERISMDGLHEMHEYSKDERLFRHLVSQPSKTKKDTEKYLNKFLEQIGKKVIGRTRMAWFLKKIDTSRIFGTASLLTIDYDYQSVQWGYGIDPQLWGQGYVFEIQNILKKYVFEELCLNRLWGGARIDNQATISTLKVAGMKNEGIQRQNIRDQNGNYYDSWFYSMLAEEYFILNKKNQNKIIKQGLKQGQLEKIIAEVLHYSGVVTDDLEMQDSPLWDSLKQMELIAALEVAYKTRFTVDEIVEMRSVKNIKDIINARLIK